MSGVDATNHRAVRGAGGAGVVARCRERRDRLRARSPARNWSYETGRMAAAFSLSWPVSATVNTTSSPTTSEGRTSGHPSLLSLYPPL